MNNDQLTEEQKRVLFEKGTEAPFSGELLKENRAGNYTCANCGRVLFASNAKFEATLPGLRGWPSFDQALPGAVRYQPDTSEGMHRTEIVCANCGGHLGHVFEGAEDSPTDKHYCVNSVCLGFSPDDTNEAK